VFERNEQEISQIIEENLEGVLSGKTSMEEVLRQHPQYAAGLRRELEAALWLHSRREEVKPRPGYISASRKRVVARIKQEARSQNGKHVRPGFSLPQQRRMFQWAAALILVVFLLSSVGGLVSYAQNALPGQQLYGIKRTSENIALEISLDAVKKAELSFEFTDRRFQEVKALIEAGETTYIQSTLADFNLGVKQSLALLEQVSNSMPAEKLVLAQRLTANLAGKAEQLAGLVNDVPASIQADLIAARDLTLTGASSSLSVINEMNVVLGTSTPTGTTVPELIMPQTSTPEPSKTPRPVLNKTQPSTEITRTPPDSIKKATNTPRPTNPNRPTANPGNAPTKEPKPTKDDKQPTQAEKPTRVEKPTKTDKPNK
jgi:hypothetical protein